jgi:hypothetical protein
MTNLLQQAIDSDDGDRAARIIQDALGIESNGRWDLSFWDEKFNGYWTLVGYHGDGSLAPTRFESYAEFQKRVAAK